MTTKKNMNQKLEVFHKLNNLNKTNITTHFKNILKKANDYIINLHKLNCIDDKILKHTVGIRCKNGI